MPAARDEFYGPHPSDIYDYDSLDKACKLWVECFRQLRTALVSRPSGPREANKWLRKLAYRVIRESLDFTDGYDDLPERIEAYRRREGHTPGSPGAFQTGLLAIFAHAPNGMTADQRYQMGRQLEYAHYHLVPDDFLEAFLRDVGARKAIDDAGSGSVHADYIDWVVGQLWRNKAKRSVLDTYPEAISEAIAVLRKPKARADDDDGDWT